MADSKNLGAACRRSRILDLPDGKHIEIKALTLADWSHIEDEAVRYAKRCLIETYTQNVDLLPEARREEIVLEAFKRAEAIRHDVVSWEQIVSWSMTARGQLTQSWLGMRGANLQITFDEVSELLAAHKEHVKFIAEAVAEMSLPTLKKESSTSDDADSGESEDSKKKASRTIIGRVTAALSGMIAMAASFLRRSRS